MERRELLIAAAALAASALAWLILALHPHRGGFLAAFLMWNVMLVAMMLPPLVPWLVALPRQHVLRFAVGYFGIWTTFCGAAAAVQAASPSTLEGWTPSARAGLLTVAGLFQFTSVKERCLRYCRSPLGSLLTQWHSGRGWALRMGIRYGVHCLGCCWALMALALVLGVMNLWWMAALTLVMCIEKLAPGGERWARALGAVLLVAGLGSLFVP